MRTDRGGAAVAGAWALAVLAAVAAAVALTRAPSATSRPDDLGPRVVRVTELPPPRLAGPLGLEEAILARRSVRAFRDAPLAADDLGQLLWAAQGERPAAQGGRTVPSAGGLYPLEVYIVTADGVGHYRPGAHALARVVEGDVRPRLATAALEQRAFATAPAVVVVAGVEARSAEKYGERAEQYVLIEAGHAGQNLLLQAAALDVGAVPTGAFDDADVAALLELPEGTQPLYLIPVGYPATDDDGEA